MVAPAADEHRPVNLVEHVAKHLRAAHAIVHVNPHRTHADAAGLVNVVVPNLVSTERIVAPGINGAHIPCLERDVVDVVELDEMVVAGEENRAVGMIVNQVVRRAQTHPVHPHRRDVAPGPAALALEMTILHEVTTGRERLPVAPAQRHAAIAGLKHVAAHDTVVRAAVDGDAQVADVAQEATHDPIARAAADFETAAARGFEHQTVDEDAAGVGQFDEGLVEQRKDRLAGIHRAGRPEVEHAGFPFEEPFARLVEFLEQIQIVEPLAGAETVETVRRRGLDEVPIQVERRDALVGVGPVPRPKAMHPQIARVTPAAGALGGVEKAAGKIADVAAVVVSFPAAGRKARELLPRAFIRPTGERHRTSGKEQFTVRGCGWPAEATRLHLAVVGDAERAEVDLQDVTAGRFVEPGEDRSIRHRLESRKRAPAKQPDAFVAVSAPDNGPVERARVGGRQFEGVGPEKVAAA